MRKLKRMGAMVMALVLAFSLSVTAFAAVEDTGFADVAADAWYAEAVEYVRDNGLMSGTSATTFAPNDTMTRSMLATTLYREAGSPAVSGSDAFTDTQEDAWYADAVLWASQEGVISGYGNGLFGTNDPVSREQIATILWRYAGSPSADAGQDFADESEIASYAVAAVDWARANGVVNGADGNRLFLVNQKHSIFQLVAIRRKSAVPLALSGLLDAAFHGLDTNIFTLNLRHRRQNGDHQFSSIFGAVDTILHADQIHTKILHGL